MVNRVEIADKAADLKRQVMLMHNAMRVCTRQRRLTLTNQWRDSGKQPIPSVVFSVGC